MKTVTVETLSGNVQSVVRQTDKNYSLTDRELAKIAFVACFGMNPGQVTIEDEEGSRSTFDFIGH